MGALCDLRLGKNASLTLKQQQQQQQEWTKANDGIPKIKIFIYLSILCPMLGAE